MECKTVRVLSFDDLKLYTDNFNKDNLIGKFQFGKVYRGYIGAQEVTVKKWEDPIIYIYQEGDNERRFKDEILLLWHSKTSSHPNLVKLIGYCNEGEEKLGVIYDLKPLDSVHNLVLKDSFTWLQRIKVILGFACLLEFMHAKDPPNLPYLVRNIDAAHIMVDQDYNPRLLDFGMITGGIFPDRRNHSYPCVFGCHGYINMDYKGVGPGWSDKVDVFAFGTLLLMLISKRVYNVEDREDCDVPCVDEWAENVYYAEKSAACCGRWFKCSLVHRSLQVNPGFYSSDGHSITKLGISCVDSFERPTMKQVVKELLKLRVVQHHAEILGIDQMHRTMNVI